MKKEQGRKKEKEVEKSYKASFDRKKMCLIHFYLDLVIK